MNNTIIIIPKETVSIGACCRRSCRLELNTDDKIRDLWWEYPVEVPMPDAKDSDAYLIAVILLAMKLKANIEVRGAVSRSLLANLVEFQRAWNKWCPNIYHLIEINAEHIQDKQKSSGSAVAAFSGGIDAQFTVYRHAKGLAGYDRQKIAAGVLIQGFEIPLADKAGFAKTVTNAQLILDDFDIPLFAVRTNITEALDINWEHYCGAALISVLYGFKAIAGIGLVGSSDSYDELSFPWGTNPITDPLLSSSAFEIKHDGSGFNRVEKVKIISDWTTGIKYLRVCWEGDISYKNCGHCEKCVRTRLNFLLAGQPNPVCFDGPLRTQDINKITLSGEGARVEWRLLLKVLQEDGRYDELTSSVRRVLRRPSVRWEHLLPIGSRRRAWAKRIAGKN